MTKTAGRCWVLDCAAIVGVTAFIQMLNTILMPKGSPVSDGFWLTTFPRCACHSSASWYKLRQERWRQPPELSCLTGTETSQSVLTQEVQPTELWGC